MTRRPVAQNRQRRGKADFCQNLFCAKQLFDREIVRL